MGKLKVPAWVGVPSRRLLRLGAVVSRVRPGGRSLRLLTTNQEYGGVPPYAETRAYLQKIRTRYPLGETPLPQP